MKRSVLFLVSLFVVTTMVAAPVSQQRAMQVAQQFIPVPDGQAQAPGVRVEEQPANIVYTHPMPKSGRPAFYVVNVGGSFVIVSADDVAHQVLGYNLGKSWPTSEDGALQLPPQVKSFFDDLAAQMEAAIETDPNLAPDAEWTQPQSAPRRRIMSEMPDSVGPLLTTTWDQGQFYNALCPEDQNSSYDGHCPTGCVATAMAQIISYWGYPVRGRGIHSYNTNYGTLTVNYDSVHYDFAHMPAQLSNTSTAQEIQAVANLMRDCGVATNMVYSFEESNAFDIDARAGLINFFLFSPNISFAEKVFFTDSEWNAMLKADLSSNRPVMYSGRGTGTHTFVCDGYKQDGSYHFNFGWGGFCDGWYQLSALNPAQFFFSSNQTSVLGIVPDSTANVILGQTTGTSSFMVDNPLDFFHLLGHNTYEGNNYGNPCNNTINFISRDTTMRLVADILEYEDQTLTINDANGTLLRFLSGGGENDLSPVVSLNEFNINYSGGLYYPGFKLKISRDNGCRMVSNIVASVDTTTIHLMWTENGNTNNWLVEYGLSGFSLGTGTRIETSVNPYDITGLARLKNYDVYISPACDSISKWRKISIKTDAPYWQDVVTVEPATFSIDEETDEVLISCAEDFVWYVNNYFGHNAKFISDIDLGGYKWKPNSFTKNIEGNSKTIYNLYIDEGTNRFAGLFNMLADNEIRNLGIENAYISGGERTGGFCGEAHGSIKNCYISNSTVNGTEMVGGLVGANYGTIINCYANVSVFCKNYWAGLLTANTQGELINCYAFGSIQINTPLYYAGIAGYGGGSVDNCYSADMPKGVIDYPGDVVVADTSSFFRSNSSWSLRTPIRFEGIQVDNLLDALNKKVEQINDSSLRLWIAMEDSHLPHLGDFYVVQCPSIDNLSIQNKKDNGISSVVIEWDEKGEATNWEIKYQPKNSPQDSATIVHVTSKPYTLYNLPLGRDYVFSVRSICDSVNKSGWVSLSKNVDLPFWTDVVTEQPEGYVEDIDGNVIISSAEGLAWMSVLTNGYHNQQKNSFKGKTIILSADIDLQGYRWGPVGHDESSWFMGTFDGNNHIVSNLYIKSPGPNLGLFGCVREAEIKNLKLIEGLVFCDGGERWQIGGLIGYGWEIKGISNCSSDVEVHGYMRVASLCGHISYGKGNQVFISNCQSSGPVYGGEYCGGLIGEARGVIVQNCFSTSDLLLSDGNSGTYPRGGLIGGAVDNITIRNCYSSGSIDCGDNTQRCGTAIGYRYMDTHTQYVYGLKNGMIEVSGFSPIGFGDVIADTSSIYNYNGQQILTTPISLDDSLHDNLIDALNAWVSMTNDPNLKIWIPDTAGINDGYPIFGNCFEPACYNPTNVRAINATIAGDDTIRTRICWEQEGSPLSWEILYVGTQQSIDSGTIIKVTSNPCELSNLPVGEVLDIYIRAICDSDNISGWSVPIQYLPDKLRWTEIVTTQPDSYSIDDNGCVYITSAEDFAWLASVVNGLNGNSEDMTNIYNIRKIVLTSDIDLSEYRWVAIGNREQHLQRVIFDGNGHTVTGLYCNEVANYQGLFGYISGVIKDLYVNESSVSGLVYCGTIAGMSGAQVYNCLVSGDVYGVQYLGGLVGEYGGTMCNSAFVGMASTRPITLQNSYNGFVGGISGSASYCNITNSYVASEIPWSIFSGVVIGPADGGSLNNVFALDYTRSLDFAYTENPDDTYSFFTGSEATWTLNTPPYVDGAFRSDLLDALNAWVDANNSDSIYRHWVADTAMTNGGFPIFAPMPVEPVGPITEIDNLKETNRPARKVFERGQLYILLPNGTRYDATGKKVE